MGSVCLWLLLAAVVEEAGCGLIWVLSPRLTAIYNADYTVAFFAAAPAFRVVHEALARMLAPLGEAVVEPLDMVLRLEAAFAVAIAGYVGGMLALHVARNTRGRATVAVVVIGTAVFRVTLIFLPGLFSTDVFSYVMYGRVAAVYGDSPYLLAPNDFPRDPFLDWVFPFWRDQPSVYGPVWTDLSWLLSRLTANTDNFTQVTAYRLVLEVFDVATLAALWWGLHRIQPNPRERLRDFALYAWNPLVLFDLTGASHNDVVMLALLLLGMLPLSGGLITIALSELGALVKYATLIPAAMFAAAYVAGARGCQKLVRLATVSLVTLIVTVVAALPWMSTRDALALLTAAAGGRLVLNSAPDLLALTLADHLLVPGGVDPADAAADARLSVRTLARAIFALYVLGEVVVIWRLRGRGPAEVRRATIRASTGALLLLPLLVLSWVWSWYFSWSLALATLLGWRSPLTWLTVTYTLVALPIVYAHQYLSDDLPGAFVVLLALGPPAVLWAGRMLRGRSFKPWPKPRRR